MKILIITMNVGRTAPGIVFERFIYGLSQIHDVDVVTADFDPTMSLSKVNNIIEIRKARLHHRVPKLLISIFGINPIDWLWSERVIKQLRDKQLTNYDLVFSLISFHNYAGLIAAAKYASMIKSKFATYSVDAIPAPIGWSQNDSYYRGVRKMMKSYLSKVDLFFAANEQMLQYQLTTFNPKKSSICEVLYNTNDGKMKFYENPESDKYTFLYTGSIYQVRKSEYILKAFERLLITYPTAELVFVGTKLSEEALAVLNMETKKSIRILSFTKDLAPYYQEATALIDIDADLENDVFLSSKIVNYLLINRVIISETGKNSPSRKIFEGIESIIQCDHDVLQLYEAMKKAISIKKEVKFEDRKSKIELFSIKNVIQHLNNLLEKEVE